VVHRNPNGYPDHDTLTQNLKIGITPLSLEVKDLLIQFIKMQD
jgi:hypothetical protein